MRAPSLAVGAGLVLWTAAVFGQAPIDGVFTATPEHAAIGYATAPTSDAIARIAREVAAGTRRLEFEPAHGYLRSLLRALDIGESSQLAVFSKTSLQAPMISPANPRAIYFNDFAVVAWPGGGFIEIAVQDPRQGVMFYVLEQRAVERPQFVRPSACLTCHVSYVTLNVPGALVRSVATAPGGQTLPFIWNGTTSHRTPHAERWAGWYVTGKSGSVAHLGNALQRGDGTGEEARPAVSALPSLSGRVSEGRTITPHSDVSALLVFDHQMHGMNQLTRAGWEVRVALSDDPPAAGGVAERVAVDVVDYLLFVDEASLAGPVGGDSGFAAAFAARGPADRAGRSLRDLDLVTRLLKHPCSYLVYSEAFDALPPVAKAAVYARLWHVLSGAERETPRYARLSRADRQAITEILRETKQDLPPYFGNAVR